MGEGILLDDLCIIVYNDTRKRKRAVYAACPPQRVGQISRGRMWRIRNGKDSNDYAHCRNGRR